MDQAGAGVGERKTKYLDHRVYETCTKLFRGEHEALVGKFKLARGVFMKSKHTRRGLSVFVSDAKREYWMQWKGLCIEQEVNARLYLFHSFFAKRNMRYKEICGNFWKNLVKIRFKKDWMKKTKEHAPNTILCVKGSCVCKIIDKDR